MIEKREVVMHNPGHGHFAKDYVPIVITAKDGSERDFLSRYVADAKTRWQSVIVGETHHSGPAGDDGHTHYPEHLVNDDEIAVCPVCKE